MLTQEPVAAPFLIAGASRYPTIGTASTAPTAAFNNRESLKRNALRECAEAFSTDERSSLPDSPGGLTGSLILSSKSLATASADMAGPGPGPHGRRSRRQHRRSP